MNRHFIPLGRILGIPIGLDYSWFLIFGLFTWALAVGYYPAEFKNWPVAQYWILGGVTSILLFVSVILHELGHSFVALRYKVPVRSITLFIFGGVAQIGGEPPSAGAEFWIAIAGPIVSFALAIIFGAFQTVFMPLSPLLAVAKYLAFLNGALGLFNLIPGFPLDGGRVLRAVVWGVTHNLRKATVLAANVGRFIAFLFIFAGVWQVFAGNLINGLWIAFIGWFLESAAMAQVQQQVLQGALAGHRVAEVMGHAFTTIPADVTLDEVVHNHVLGNGHRSLMVRRGDDVIGLLTLTNIKAVPQSEWSVTRADQAMMSATHMKSVQPTAELWPILEEMDRDGVDQLPVVTNGHVEGILTRENIGGYLRILKELGTW
jgi:Zn-dependent protease